MDKVSMERKTPNESEELLLETSERKSCERSREKKSLQLHSEQRQLKSEKRGVRGGEAKVGLAYSLV